MFRKTCSGVSGTCSSVSGATLWLETEISVYLDYSSFSHVFHWCFVLRLSKRQSSLKPATSWRLSQSKEGLKSVAVEVAASSPSFKSTSSDKGILGAHCDKTAMMPAEEEIVGIDCNHNIELKEMRNDKMNVLPETFTVCSDGHVVDRTENSDAAVIANSSAVILSHTTGPTRTEKVWDSSSLSTSTPKASLDRTPTSRGEEFPVQELVNILVQEEDHSKDLKDSTVTSGGSQLSSGGLSQEIRSRRPANRPHRSRRVSLVEKYSLSNKRKSMIQKSIRRSIAKKKVARDSSVTSFTHLSCK